MFSIIFYFVLLLFCKAFGTDESLYDVLGVMSIATAQEIKEAYKKLAMLWHPDKHLGDVTANERFLKINEAYETLVNPHKRNVYDTFGRSASILGQPFHQDVSSHQSDFSHFDDESEIGSNHKAHKKYNLPHMNYRTYRLKILPESYHTPTLVYGYAHDCLQCKRLEHIWNKLLLQLQPIGVHLVVVNLELDGHLRDEFRAHNSPEVMAVISGQVRFYRGEYTVKDILEFLRTVLLSDQIVLTLLDNYTKNEFLESWHVDNRVRVIHISDDTVRPALRILLSAFYFKSRVAMAWAGVHSEIGLLILKQFNLFDVSIGHGEAVLVFHEDSSTPVHILKSMSPLTRVAVDDIISKYKYLQLPRLTSQELLIELCPVEMSSNHSKLCVILMSERGLHLHPNVMSFIQEATRVIRNNNILSKRVQLAYIHQNTQQRFCNSIVPANMNFQNLTGRVVVIWRPNSAEIRYSWLSETWNYSKINESCDNLKFKLLTLLGNASSFDGSVSAYISVLQDEHAALLYIRIMRRMQLWITRLWYWCRDMDPADVATSMTIAMVTGLVLSFMWQMRECEDTTNRAVASVNSNNVLSDCNNVNTDGFNHDSNVHNRKHSSLNVKNTLRITCLNSQNYIPLVTESVRGDLTVILMLTKSCKSKLLPQFAKELRHYVSLECLNFAYGLLDDAKIRDWLTVLMTCAYGVDSEYNRDNDDYDNINFDNDTDDNEFLYMCKWSKIFNRVYKCNCIGMVLVLNGYRRYFSIFHHKIKILWNDAPDSNNNVNLNNLSNQVIGVFSHLSDWMDSLFDGKVARISVDDWPELQLQSSVS